MRWLLLLLCSGCVETERISLFDLEEAKTLILGQADLASQHELTVFDVTEDQPSFSVSLSETDRLFGVASNKTLSELGLSAGQQKPTQYGRPFPDDSRIYEAIGQDRVWQETSESVLADILGSQPLPALGPGACEAAGGCFRFDEESYCAVPCEVLRNPAPPDDPTEPEPPHFGDCPTGWIETASFCEPPPSTINCPAGEAMFIGRGCETIGSACPLLEWPSRLPPNRDVLYVKANAPAGGTGSQTSPFNQINDALAAVTNGNEIIALASGSYSGDVILTGSLLLAGACVERTRLDGVVISDGTEIEVRDLEITNPASTPTIRTSQGILSLSGVLVRGGLRGLDAEGAAQLFANDLVVRDAITGVRLNGAVATLSAVTIERASSTGLRVEAGGTAEVTDLLVRNVNESGASSAAAIQVFGGTLQLSRGLMEKNAGEGLLLEDRARATVQNLVVRDGDLVRPWWGVCAKDNSQLTVDRLVITNISWYPLVIQESWATFRDIYVADNQQSEFRLIDRSNVVIERALFARNREPREKVLDMENAVVTLADVTFEDNSEALEGLWVMTTTMTFNRVSLEGFTSGLVIQDSNVGFSAGAVNDFHVRGVPGAPNGALDGFSVRDRSSIDFARLAVSDMRGYGFYSTSDGDTTVSDLSVERTDWPGVSLGLWGGTYALERVSIKETGHLGIRVQSTEATLSEVVCEYTHPFKDAELSNMGTAYGLLIVGYGGEGVPLYTTTLGLSQFSFKEAEAGLLIGNGTQAVRLERGMISNTTTGIDIRNHSFQLDTEDVVFRHNETNVRQP